MHQKNFTFHSALPKEEQDGFIDLDRLMAVITRRIRTILAGVVIFVALAVAYLLTAPSTYTSATQILLDETMTKYAEDQPPQASSQQADMEIASAVEILKSNEMALRVVDAAGLVNNDAILNPPQSPVALIKSGVKLIASAFKPAKPPLTAEEAREAQRQQIAATLQDALKVERVTRSSVVSVSFGSTDQQLAAKVTAAYADAYLTDQLNANFDATERASVWLQERLNDLRERSQQASLDVEKYKAENGLTSTGGELMSEQQISDLNKQLIIAQADTASASARYYQYKSIIDQGPDNAVKNATISSSQTDNSVLQDLKTRYLNVQKREQDVTQNFGASHPQAVALKAEREDITRQIYQELQQLTASYKNEFDVAQSRAVSLRNSIEGVVGKNSEANKSLVQLNALNQKATALKTLYESYLSRYEEASQQRSFPIAKARVISAAGVPSAPSSPKKTLVLALSIVLGLMAGGAFAALQEFRDRYFRVEADVRAALGLKFLGYLPLLGQQTFDKKKKKGRRLKVGPATAEDAETGVAFERIMRVSVEAPRSIFAETLRNAKLASDVMLQGRADRVIGVVSALPGEGKSTTAANFAALLASSGKRTLLIDADLRNPGLSRMLKSPPQTGLIEAALGEIPWASAVRVDPRTKLAILPVVLRDHLLHTSELLSSQGMLNLMESARKMFDYIVVDLAPLGPVIDAKAFAPQVDAFLFVAEWGATPTNLVRDLLEQEPQINSRVLGVILNKTDMSELSRYSDFGGTERYRQKYTSYYTEEQPKAEIDA
ncbi:polysaccharide biosynthesis tyrosine autokinase (plasmid) [Rhizobium sp. CB3060]|uniref:polysaccharide biosynthesis tyrosine autokinase n=1 Tax=unclassified Rhizobium TaxID=2613769 RepID=UPI0021A63DBD|nr:MULTISPECIES: polysaccharide biosynthesis tyrosine autokinase [Rhizobium]MDK4740209.1 polysaccharide biosynthesis tyrosine autokinase [Rhizobium sp. CNPSo 3464]UWU24975.1 polysaccharide biosynthesis tyrosine autokinase [Rhizobium tropici]